MTVFIITQSIDGNTWPLTHYYETFEDAQQGMLNQRQNEWNEMVGVFEEPGDLKPPQWENNGQYLYCPQTLFAGEIHELTKR